nr:NAD(P)/FAD-dependent oxidoreductase [Ensifer sp. YR511]
MQASNKTSFDLVIAGAGPAGMAAAAAATARGLSVAIVDENLGLGGQIFRNVAISGVLEPRILGKDYYSGAGLVAEVAQSGATHFAQSTIWMIERQGEAEDLSVGIQRDGRAEVLLAKSILIATGALERPFPIKGWTLPGVLTAGAAQTMLKASGVVPAGKVVLAGTGPLLYLLAAQFVRASVHVAAVLDTTPRSNWLRAFRHFPSFLISPYFRKGIGLLAEVQRSTKVVRNVSSLEAEGSGQLRSIRYTASDGPQELEVDTLLLHQGVAPHVNLAMAAGCKHFWSEERLAFEPQLDHAFRTNIRGISIAGDGGGIGGALAAEISGRVAALHIVEDLSMAPSAELASSISKLKHELHSALRGRRFIDALYRPLDAFRMPGDDGVICRCEEVAAGAVRDAAKQGAQGPNVAKTFLRTGMGPCQGRLCGLTVTELMARQLGKSPEEVGYFHIRNPVKPISLGAIAAMKGENETKRLF